MSTTKYPTPSEETVKAIKDLFNSRNESWVDFSFNLETKENGYYLTISRMYEYVTFKEELSTLLGYMKIAELLGVKDGDEIERISYNGCPSCDYGSKYTVKLKFW